MLDVMRHAPAGAERDDDIAGAHELFEALPPLLMPMRSRRAVLNIERKKRGLRKITGTMRGKLLASIAGAQIVRHGARAPGGFR